MRALALRAGGVAGLGAATYAMSELAFYPLELAPDLWVGVLAYGLCAWAMVCALSLSRRWDRDGWWLGAGLFGFLVEGAVVSELYAAPPLTIVWTPLAWHAAVTVWGGLLLLPAAMARGPGAAALAAGALGAGLGVWSGWMWTAEAGPGLPAYAAQIALAWIMLAAGHAVWARAAPALERVDLRADAAVLAGLAGALWAGGWALPHAPASLLLPLLAGVTVLALRAPGGPPRPRAPASGLAALAATAALPLAATAAHAMSRPWPDWEANVVALLLLGGPAAWFWGGALLRGIRDAARR